MNYKIHEHGTVFFPKDSLSKITDKLKANSISYEISGGVKYTFINNNYKKFKFLAYKALDKELRINNIIKKISSLNDENLDKLLLYLEEYRYE